MSGDPARPLRVVLAPDSFKGTLGAAAAADALAAGWHSRRPDDDLRTCPLADGGEGTLDVLTGDVGRGAVTTGSD
jgi:glycerate kinase